MNASILIENTEHQSLLLERLSVLKSWLFAQAEARESLVIQEHGHAAALQDFYDSANCYKGCRSWEVYESMKLHAYKLGRNQAERDRLIRFLANTLEV